MTDTQPRAIEDHPRTVTSPERRAALDEHIITFLVDNPASRYNSSIATRDAIEHGWHGATADIAERLEAIIDEAARAHDTSGRLSRAVLARLVRELAEQLKAEVGA